MFFLQESLDELLESDNKSELLIMKEEPSQVIQEPIQDPGPISKWLTEKGLELKGVPVKISKNYCILLIDKWDFI